jgi:hypothetical protein
MQVPEGMQVCCAFSELCFEVIDQILTKNVVIKELEVSDAWKRRCQLLVAACDTGCILNARQRRMKL